MQETSTCIGPNMYHRPEHVLRKNHHCTFDRKIWERPFLRILPQNLQFLSVENSDFLALCNLLPMFFNPKFSLHKFLPHLFYSYFTLFTFFSLENSHDLFLVITPFLRFSVLPYFHVLQMMNPIPIFSHYTPLTYTPTWCFHVSTPFFVLS